MRAWARSRGFPVGDRGRLSPSLVALYVTEHRTPEQRSGTTEPKARAAARRGTVKARSPWNWPALEGESAPAQRQAPSSR